MSPRSTEKTEALKWARVWIKLHVDPVLKSRGRRGREDEDEISRSGSSLGPLHRCHLLLSLTFFVAQRVEWHVGQFLSVRQRDRIDRRPSEAAAPFHHSSQSVLLIRPEAPRGHNCGWRSSVISVEIHGWVKKMKLLWLDTRVPAEAERHRHYRRQKGNQGFFV